MTTMKALKAVSPGVAEVQQAPKPTLRPGSVLVKVSAVALNPTDWKGLERKEAQGNSVGCDLAGTVVEIEPGVKKGLAIGDRVAAFVFGNHPVHPDSGAFAEYVAAKAEILWKVPDNLSDQEAASITLGLVTVGQALFQALEIPLPKPGESTAKPILIYGGSTATGILAIQFAKAKRNFDLVKSYGADAAFDYSDDNVKEDISSWIESNAEPLVLAFDCIATDDSARLSAAVLSSRGKYVTVGTPKEPFYRDDVTAQRILAYTAFGDAFERGGANWEAKPEDTAFADTFLTLSQKLFAQGTIRPAPIDSRSGGLDAVSGGLEDLKEGRVSGKKLVYSI